MGDAAHVILTQDCKTCTGNFFVDEEVLKASGVNDFKKYQVDKSIDEKDLMPDFFI